MWCPEIGLPIIKKRVSPEPIGDGCHLIINTLGKVPYPFEGMGLCVSGSLLKPSRLQSKGPCHSERSKESLAWAGEQIDN